MKSRLTQYVVKSVVCMLIFSMFSPALTAAFADTADSGQTASVSGDTYGTVSENTYAPVGVPLHVPSQDPLSQFNYGITATSATYDTYADGLYTINYVVNSTTTGKELSTFKDGNGNADHPGRILIQNGKYTFSFRGTNANLFTSVKAVQNGKTSEAVFTDEKESNIQYTRVSLDINDLNQPITLDYTFNDSSRSANLVLDASTLTMVGVVDPVPTPGPTDPDLKQPAIGVQEKVSYTVLKDGTGETSIMDSYMQKPAVLVTTADGKRYVQLGINSSSMVTALQTNINGQYTDVDVIAKDAAANTRTVQFPADALTAANAKISAKVHVQIPDIGYDHWYYVQFKFDAEAASPAYANGTYHLNYAVLHATREESSTMSRYFTAPAVFTAVNGRYHVSFTVKSSSIVTGLKTSVNGKLVDTEVVSQDTAKNERTIRFQVDNLKDILNAQVHVKATPTYEADYNIRLQFDAASLVPVTATPETPAVPGAPEVPAVPVPEPGTVHDGIADGQYSASITAYKNGTKETSVMDGYLGKPATVIKKSGKYYVQVLINSSSWIKTFKVSGQEAEVISTSGDTRIVQFPVANLPRKVKVTTHVIVPGLVVGGVPYDHTYNVDLQIGSLTGYEAPVLTVAPTALPLDFAHLAVGTYKLPFSIVMSGIAAGASTPLDRFMPADQPVQLTVEKGTRYVTITLNNGSDIKALRIQDKNGYKEAELLSSDEAKNTKTMKFKVSDYTKNVPAQLVTTGGVSIASTSAAAGETVYDFAFKFDTAKVKVDTNTTASASNKRSNNLADGEYTTTYRILQNGTDNDSALSPYMDHTARLNAQNGKVQATITISDSAALPVFMTDWEGKYTHPQVLDISADGKTRTITFEVPDLDSKLSIFAHMNASSRYMTNEKIGGQLLFDRSTLKSADGKADAQTPPTAEAAPAEPSGTTGAALAEKAATDSNHSASTGSAAVPAAKDATQKYNIGVKVYKDKSNELSVMNDYIQPTATLVEENGQTYAELTLNNGSWMPVLQIEQDGKLKDVEKVSSIGKTTVIRFQVDNLSDKINAYTHVVVPGLIIGGVPYDHWYNVQIQFDEASKKAKK
ncbi:NEAT domain-containing protein [Paenibacillus wulumuqiensis]|uniref:NEAT domain-containing protein n=1 Tax=Paenibacillus wulumuqiensis TaxID=1567107 RepID=UPI000A78CD0C|nr:NEAT domain-containing protein [Paenibacillus wulumuqiensis]